MLEREEFKPLVWENWSLGVVTGLEGGSMGSLDSLGVSGCHYFLIRVYVPMSSVIIKIVVIKISLLKIESFSYSIIFGMAGNGA